MDAVDIVSKSRDNTKKDRPKAKEKKGEAQLTCYISAFPFYEGVWV